MNKELPRALSVKQPWAWMIVHGIKTIETRTLYRSHQWKSQEILIHACGKWGKNERLYWNLILREVERLVKEGSGWALKKKAEINKTINCEGPSISYTGGIIGAAKITSSIILDENNIRDSYNHFCIPIGYYELPVMGYNLKSAKRFIHAVQCPGQLGLWKPPERLHEAIKKEITFVCI